MKIDIDYPEFLFLKDGRPEVYSAVGSHGTWPTRGNTCLYNQLWIGQDTKF